MKFPENHAHVAAAAFRAIQAGDLETAELHVEELWRRRELEPDNVPLFINASSNEALLLEAEGDLEEAERMWAGVVLLDQRLGDPMLLAAHCQSLAIVRARRGNHEGAADAYHEAAKLYRTQQRFHCAGALAGQAQHLYLSERFDEALTVLDEARAVVKTEPLTPLHDLAAVHLGAGDVLRRKGRAREAFDEYVLVTKMASAQIPPKVVDRIAAAWDGIGLLSRDAFQNSRAQAAIAFFYASEIATRDKQRAAFAKSLEELDERALAVGDPALFRVTYRYDEVVHLASARRGLFVTKTTQSLTPGQIVGVTIENEVVTAIEEHP